MKIKLSEVESTPFADVEITNKVCWECWSESQPDKGIVVGKTAGYGFNKEACALTKGTGKMKNIKQIREAFEAVGFAFGKVRHRWPWNPSYEAVKKNADGTGIRVSFQFGNQQGRKGKPLTEALTYAFPLLDGNRGLLNGAKARDFSAGRMASRIIGKGCHVRTNGCTSALFENGKFIGKF